MTALHELSATEALARFRSRELSPVELLKAALARADALEPTVNALPCRYDEQALEQARAAEQRYAAGGDPSRPLDGLPVAVKEEAPIAGLSWTEGSLLHEDRVADATAAFAQRILDAGGIVHARTATPEFCCAPVTHSRLWGVTRNPWDANAAVGGSSGGSGAALAAGYAPLATGSDIGGSIRIPAAFCGVLGFKPPHGRVPEFAPVNRDYYCHEGPMARTVADVRLLENVIAGPHPDDVVSLRPKLEIPESLGDVRGWRIALCERLGDFDVDPEIAANLRAVADALRAAGAIVEEVELPWTTSEIVEAGLAHLGSIFGAGVASIPQEARELMTDYALDFAAVSQTLPPGAQLAGMELEGRLYPPLGRMLEEYRVLLAPTFRRLPYEAGVTIPFRDFSADAMTLPFNMFSSCPVMSVPSGQSASGLPTAVQVIGPTYDDVAVFNVSAAIERERPWPLVAPAAAVTA
jgi:aspartyl-tRNA(Asn)/glutamyl-tRNA(Gln) amidotransferase subunit A